MFMYELTNWEGMQLSMPLQYNTIEIDEEFIKNYSLNLGEENLNVFNVEFKKEIKKADKIDYLFSIFSGTLSCGLDYLISKNNKINIKAGNEGLKSYIKLASKFYNLSNDALIDADKKINVFFNKQASEIKNIDKKIEIIEDFSKGLSYFALFTSVMNSVYGCKIGKDKDGDFVIDNASTTQEETSTPVKIVNGVVDWLVDEAIMFDKKNKATDLENDALKVKGGMEYVCSFIENLNESLGDNFNIKDLKKYLHKQIEKINTDIKDVNSLEDLLKNQTAPVMVNRILVRSYVFLRQLISEINEHKIKDVSGLKVINLKNCFEKNDRIVKRMDTVSTGVFSVWNAVYAGAYLIKHAPEGPKAVVVAFASKINFVNVLELVIVVKNDKEYIKEDLKETTANVIKKVKNSQSITSQDIERTNDFARQERKILYSLELQKINRDIQITKDNKVQLKKDLWKEEWMSLSKEGLKLNKVFEEDEEKVYQSLETYTITSSKIWVHVAAMELMSFTPYFQLEKDDDKKYKGLKLVDNKYVKEVFCKKQKYISEKYVDTLSKTYKKYYGYLGNDTVKTLATVAGATVVTVGTAGAAAAFAPAIAVGIAGGTFAGLSGAALTSASLAAIGGGAIAAGGMGIAGGTMLITGGGLLAGLTASGIGATAMSLLSSSIYVRDDYAKLLTKCNDIFLNKFGMLSEVKLIQEKTNDSLDSLRTQISLIESIIKNDSNKDKERTNTLKELKKSEKYIDRANEGLLNMINTYEKNN